MIYFTHKSFLTLFNSHYCVRFGREYIVGIFMPLNHKNNNKMATEFIHAINILETTIAVFGGSSLFEFIQIYLGWKTLHYSNEVLRVYKRAQWWQVDAHVLTNVMKVSVRRQERTQKLKEIFFSPYEEKKWARVMRSVNLYA